MWNLLLAIVTGIVSAAVYDYLRERRTARRLHTAKLALMVEQTWPELAWVFGKSLECPWTAPTQDDPPRRLFAGPVDSLQAMVKRTGPHAIDLPFKALSEAEQRLVRDDLPGLPSVLRPIAEHVSDLLMSYGWLWADAERDLLLRARRSLKAITAWKPATSIPPEHEGYEVYNAVDMSLQTFRALEDIWELLQTLQPPERYRSASRLTEA